MDKSNSWWADSAVQNVYGGFLERYQIIVEQLKETPAQTKERKKKESEEGRAIGKLLMQKKFDRLASVDNTNS